MVPSAGQVTTSGRLTITYHVSPSWQQLWLKARHLSGCSCNNLHFQCTDTSARCQWLYGRHKAVVEMLLCDLLVSNSTTALVSCWSAHSRQHRTPSAPTDANSYRCTTSFYLSLGRQAVQSSPAKLTATPFLCRSPVRAARRWHMPGQR